MGECRIPDEFALSSERDDGYIAKGKLPCFQLRDIAHAYCALASVARQDWDSLGA